MYATPTRALLRGGEASRSARLADRRSGPELGIVGCARRSDARRPNRVEVVVVRAFDEHRVLGLLVRRHVVAGIVVEVDTLQVGHVTVAVRQHHADRNLVDHRPREVDRRERQHRLDAVWSRAGLVDQEIPHDTLTAARVAHRPDLLHVDLADELPSERAASRRRPCVPEIEMLFDQRTASVHSQVTRRLIDGVDAVRADRHHDVAVARENLRDVVVSPVTRYFHRAAGAGPFEVGRRARVTGRVPTVHEHDEWILLGQRGGIEDDAADLDRAWEPGRIEGGVAQVVHGARDGQRARQARVGRQSRGCNRNGDRRLRDDDPAGRDDARDHDGCDPAAHQREPPIDSFPMTVGVSAPYA